MADRRLLAVRPVRGGRLHPRRRQPGGRPGAPGMPGPGRAPWPPGAITTSSGRCGSGHLTIGRPIITAGRRAVINRASRCWPPSNVQHASGPGRMFMHRRSCRGPTHLPRVVRACLRTGSRGGYPPRLSRMVRLAGGYARDESSDPPQSGCDALLSACGPLSGADHRSGPGRQLPRCLPADGPVLRTYR